MQETEQVQENDDEDRHAGEPQDDIAQHQSSPLAREGRPAVAPEGKPGRYFIVAVLPATDGGPPGGAKRDNQARRRDETRKDRGFAGLVRRLARGRERLIDPPLGLLLGEA